MAVVAYRVTVCHAVRANHVPLAHVPRCCLLRAHPIYGCLPCLAASRFEITFPTPFDSFSYLSAIDDCRPQIPLWLNIDSLRLFPFLTTDLRNTQAGTGPRTRHAKQRPYPVTVPFLRRSLPSPRFLERQLRPSLHPRMNAAEL